jgi:heptaprenylglyceryl phosphate synthase
MNKKDIILAHALAGEYLGNKVIFLEAGSGAKQHAACDIIRFLVHRLNIPIVVGGGVNTPDAAHKLVLAGAGYIVTGTQIENIPKREPLQAFTNAIHKQ